MSYNLRSLIKDYHAFYEVLPYYLLLEERHGSSSAVTRRVQAGFDVEIYGVNIKDEFMVPGSDPHYALGYAQLQKIAEEFRIASTIPAHWRLFRSIRPSSSIVEIRRLKQ